MMQLKYSVLQYCILAFFVPMFTDGWEFFVKRLSSYILSEDCAWQCLLLV